MLFVDFFLGISEVSGFFFCETLLTFLFLAFLLESFRRWVYFIWFFFSLLFFFCRWTASWNWTPFKGEWRFFFFTFETLLTFLYYFFRFPAAHFEGKTSKYIFFLIIFNETLILTFLGFFFRFRSPISKVKLRNRFFFIDLN